MVKMIFNLMGFFSFGSRLMENFLLNWYDFLLLRMYQKVEKVFHRKVDGWLDGHVGDFCCIFRNSIRC